MLKLLHVYAIVSLFCFCDKPTESAIEVPGSDTVSWEECIQILNSGEVVMVTQTHSLDVTLHLKNKTKVTTKEPSIDLIFVEINKCGENCSDIKMQTE